MSHSFLSHTKTFCTGTRLLPMNGVLFLFAEKKLLFDPRKSVSFGHLVRYLHLWPHRKNKRIVQKPWTPSQRGCLIWFRLSMTCSLNFGFLVFSLMKNWTVQSPIENQKMMKTKHFRMHFLATKLTNTRTKMETKEVYVQNDEMMSIQNVFNQIISYRKSCITWHGFV